MSIKRNCFNFSLSTREFRKLIDNHEVFTGSVIRSDVGFILWDPSYKAPRDIDRKTSLLEKFGNQDMNISPNKQEKYWIQEVMDTYYVPLCSFRCVLLCLNPKRVLLRMDM